MYICEPQDSRSQLLVSQRVFEGVNVIRTSTVPQLQF